MSFTGGQTAIRNPHRLIAALIGAAGLLVLAGQAQAATPTVENTASVGGQTTWLESFATGGQDSGVAETLRLSLLVKHDVGEEVTGIRIDDDWDGADEATSAAIKPVTAQQPSPTGGYGYSRVNFSYEIPTANTGMGCPGDRRTDNRVVRLRARLGNAQETATTSSIVKFVAIGQCTGTQDYPFLHTWGGSNFNKSLTPGDNATFTYAGDDADIDFFSSDDNFEGVNWRLRNTRTGALGASGTDCPDGGDNDTKSTTINFPDRGRWNVEAQLLNESCAQANSGYWFAIGSADVNSTAAPSISLSSSRPANSATTIIATIGADPDDADGGRAEYVEWDLDNNGSFEATTLGDAVSGLTDELPGTAGLQVTKTVSSAAAAGSHTVRARVTDNGAMGGADSIRRTSTAATGTYQGNTPPVADNQTVTTESDAGEPVTLTASDPANGDSIASYDVTAQPPVGEGSVTPAGSGGAARTYNPTGTFAGPTTFQYTATDSIGGPSGTSSPATVTVNVTPQTQIDSTPPLNSSSSDGTFTFSSPVTTPGVTFECRIDSTLPSDFTACTSPRTYSGLDDGSHTFDVRARIGTLVDPTPASYTWVLDGTLPDTFIDVMPPNPSNDISPTFEFSSDEAIATFECRVDSNSPGDFAPCTEPYTFGATQGEHTFDVRAVDEFGRKDPIPERYTWRVDTTAPTVTFDEVPPNPSNSASAHFEFVSADVTATFECRLDPIGPGGWAPCTSPQDLGPLGQGPHTYEVRATDTATNTGPVASYTWTIDLDTPETSLDSGPTGTISSPIATFTFSSPDLTAGFECRMDSSDPGAWEECSSPQLYADLGDGPHTFEVRATDAAGNKDQSPESRSWTIDTTAPETAIDDGPSGTTGDDDADFEFSSDDPSATFECRLDAEPYGPCTTASTASYTNLGPGSHTFRVKATDSLGNPDTTPAVRTWVIDATDPTTTIDEAPSDPTGSDDATFEFSADEDATFECRLDGDIPNGTGWVACTSPQTYSDLDDRDHTFEVRATDGVNRVGGVESRTWEVDTTAPDVSITVGMPATTSSSGASFEFTSTDGSATFQCRLNGGGWQNCTSPRSYSGLDEGNNTFEVRSRDDVGNLSSPTATDTWTVVDSDAPDTFIESAPDDPTTATGASFTFISDEGGSTFECSLDSTTAYSPCTSPKGYTGLVPGTHTFRVRAIDADANTDQSPAVSTWTINQPPAAPQTPASTGQGGVGAATSKPPAITAATGKVKLRGRVSAGTVACGSANCAIKSKAKVKIDGTSYRLRVKLATSVPANGTAAITVVAPKAARTALAAAGKGIMTVKLAITSTSGNVAKKIKLKVKK